MAGVVFLASDSIILFRSAGQRAIREALGEKAAPTAAYIGAANGDSRAYFSICQAAMEGVGVQRVSMIRSAYRSDDRLNLRSADLIVLAGGDVVAGWRRICESGMREDIVGWHEKGGVLVGISAGAVHVGLWGCCTDRPSAADIFPTLGLVPYVVDAHDEDAGWRRLRMLLSQCPPSVRAVGLPRGSGLVVRGSGEIEPVGGRVVQLWSPGRRHEPRPTRGEPSESSTGMGLNRHHDSGE